MNSSLCWAIVANNKPTRQGKDVTDVPYTKFIPNLHCSRPSCTVVLSSKIESRDNGHMCDTYEELTILICDERFWRDSVPDK